MYCKYYLCTNSQNTCIDLILKLYTCINYNVIIFISQYIFQFNSLLMIRSNVFVWAQPVTCAILYDSVVFVKFLNDDKSDPQSNPLFLHFN